MWPNVSSIVSTIPNFCVKCCPFLNPSTLQSFHFDAKIIVKFWNNDAVGISNIYIWNDNFPIEPKFLFSWFC